jgi:uncharacterized protein (TIGR03435 family)
MTTARGIIVTAYRVNDRRLLGGPSWITTDLFEINGKTSTGLAVAALADQLPDLLRGVLEDRFKLQVHTEQKRLPAYALVRARQDGRMGPGLHPSAVDCAAMNRERFVAAQEKGAVAPADVANCSSRTGPGTLLAKGITMRGLADMLPSGDLERIVVDRTDLAGTFDVELRWLPIVVDANPPGQPVSLPDAPSLFSALQEQLGLRLEPREELVDVIVIDHIEHPTPD